MRHLFSIRKGMALWTGESADRSTANAILLVNVDFHCADKMPHLHLEQMSNDKVLAMETKGGIMDLVGIMESVRRRHAWNDRFTHWERSESDSETQRIERARDMVKQALSRNAWLTAEGVRLVEQGSFTNRTNIRLDSDIDLRVQHPAIKIEYEANVDARQAYLSGGYCGEGRTFVEIAADVRLEVVRELVATFGARAVDASGNKAIRVAGLAGSRAEVDVVPCFTLHHVSAGTIITGPSTIFGVAILARDGAWTLNYPDHHLSNGRNKRLRTALRFKRVVRIVKRLQADMLEHGAITNRIPSFLIECLIYLVEDRHFCFEEDDRYDRVQRVLNRVAELLSLEHLLYGNIHTEINGIKPLFGSGQAWTVAQAQSFINSAIIYLGNE